MIAKAAQLIILASLCCGMTSLQSQKKEHKSETSIRKYSIRIIETTGDTVSVADSARVKVEMYLDCTNKITKVETVVDTSVKQQRVVLSVYGTYATGSYRPMCAARRFFKDFFIHFPKAGDWIIETGEQENNTQRDSSWIIIVK